MKQNNKTVVKIDLNKKSYGGRLYEREFVKMLDNTFDFKQLYLMRHKNRLLNIPWVIYLFIKYHYFYKGPLILTNHTTWMAGKKSQNLVIVHHIDTSTSSGISGIFQKICDRALFHYKNRFQIVVTVASYWKNKLNSKGFQNVQLIYNSFNPDLYIFNQDEILDFKNKFGLKDKPIIYLGNCQRQKGVVESYEALKELNAYFVTSGIKDVEIPAKHLNLSFRDYRLLLASSDIVVTMSHLIEGWNRTAHEAMLCGTPVIGSATGGMLELFELGGGIVCRNHSELKDIASKIILQKKREIKPELRALNLDYFKSKWENLIIQITNDRI